MYVIKSEQQKSDEKLMKSVIYGEWADLIVEPGQPLNRVETPTEAIARIKALCKKKGWPLPEE